MLHQLNRYKSSITEMAFSDDGQYLAIGVMPQQLQLWQVNKTPVLLKKWRLAKPCIWHPSSSLIYAIAFDKENNFIVTVDTRGYISWWPFNLSEDETQT